MGDNKISEAVGAACSAFNATDGMLPSRMHAAIEAALPFILSVDTHLQGEAVPVACLPGYVRLAISGLAHIAMKDAPQVAKLHVGVIDNWLNSTHPQPAELSEVSGGSGELPPLPDDVSFGHSANGRAYLGYTAEQMQEYARAALAATGKQQVGEVHPDDQAVDAFAVAMKEKMAVARAKGRGGWEDPAQCSADDLSRMLRDHVDKGDPRDVANFCMMLHQRGEAIAPKVGEVHGSREQFEAWAKSKRFDTTYYGGMPEWYKSIETHSAWRSWQAALASRQPEVK